MPDEPESDVTPLPHEGGAQEAAAAQPAVEVAAGGEGQEDAGAALRAAGKARRGSQPGEFRRRAECEVAEVMVMTDAWREDQEAKLLAVYGVGAPVQKRATRRSGDGSGDMCRARSDSTAAADDQTFDRFRTRAPPPAPPLVTAETLQLSAFRDKLRRHGMKFAATPSMDVETPASPVQCSTPSVEQLSPMSAPAEDSQTLQPRRTPAPKAPPGGAAGLCGTMRSLEAGCVLNTVIDTHINTAADRVEAAMQDIEVVMTELYADVKRTSRQARHATFKEVRAGCDAAAAQSAVDVKIAVKDADASPVAALAYRVQCILPSIAAANVRIKEALKGLVVRLPHAFRGQAAAAFHGEAASAYGYSEAAHADKVRYLEHAVLEYEHALQEMKAAHEADTAAKTRRLTEGRAKKAELLKEICRLRYLLTGSASEHLQSEIPLLTTALDEQELEAFCAEASLLKAAEVMNARWEEEAAALKQQSAAAIDAFAAAATAHCSDLSDRWRAGVTAKISSLCTAHEAAVADAEAKAARVQARHREEKAALQAQVAALAQDVRSLQAMKGHLGAPPPPEKPVLGEFTALRAQVLDTKAAIDDAQSMVRVLDRATTPAHTPAQDPMHLTPDIVSLTSGLRALGEAEGYAPLTPALLYLTPTAKPLQGTDARRSSFDSRAPASPYVHPPLPPNPFQFMKTPETAAAPLPAHGAPLYSALASAGRLPGSPASLSRTASDRTPFTVTPTSTTRRGPDPLRSGSHITAVSVSPFTLADPPTRRPQGKPREEKSGEGGGGGGDMVGVDDLELSFDGPDDVLCASSVGVAVDHTQGGLEGSPARSPPHRSEESREGRTKGWKKVRVVDVGEEDEEREAAREAHERPAPEGGPAAGPVSQEEEEPPAADAVLALRAQNEALWGLLAQARESMVVLHADQDVLREELERRTHAELARLGRGRRGTADTTTTTGTADEDTDVQEGIDALKRRVWERLEKRLREGDGSAAAPPAAPENPLVRHLVAGLHDQLAAASAQMRAFLADEDIDEYLSEVVTDAEEKRAYRVSLRQLAENSQKEIVKLLRILHLVHELLKRRAPADVEFAASLLKKTLANRPCPPTQHGTKAAAVAPCSVDQLTSADPDAMDNPHAPLQMRAKEDRKRRRDLRRALQPSHVTMRKQREPTAYEKRLHKYSKARFDHADP